MSNSTCSLPSPASTAQSGDPAGRRVPIEAHTELWKAGNESKSWLRLPGCRDVLGAPGEVGGPWQFLTPR